MRKRTKTVKKTAQNAFHNTTSFISDVSYTLLLPFLPFQSDTKIKKETSPKSLEPVWNTKDKRSLRKMALLLPGHNEELIIGATILSAIKSGQSKRDIYVVDDASTDKTRKVAMELLGKDQVLSVHRSGKALAVKKAIKRFQINKRYKWLHIADADSVFAPNYFRIYKRRLDVKQYAVAVGFVQSMRGNWIATYRALTYTYSQQISRRIQSYFGMISVFPGPITCFRTDILKSIDFTVNSMTEDFDITLQVHRKNLGKIAFIPQAVNYTQDPQTIREFLKQNLRWQRGFFQGVKKYKIGLNKERIDISIGLQLLQTIVYLLQMFVLVPIIIISSGNWVLLPAIFAADFLVMGGVTLFSAFATKRWMLFGALPYFYFLRWLEIIVFIKAFIEVMILRRFQDDIKGWNTSGRRYKLSRQVLKDVAY